MGATLCVHIQSKENISKQHIEFFNAEEWTSETEIQLIHHLHELLSMVRPMGKAVSINLDVDVNDPDTAVFIINKKIKTGIEINTQKLSVREIEVIGLIMQGLTNHDIAEKLFISYETVRSHRKNILFKTGAKNTAALINYYHQTFFEK